MPGTTLYRLSSSAETAVLTTHVRAKDLMPTGAHDVEYDVAFGAQHAIRQEGDHLVTEGAHNVSLVHLRRPGNSHREESRKRRPFTLP